MIQFNSDSPLPNLPYYSSELGELPVHRLSPPSYGSPDVSITEISPNLPYKASLDVSPAQSFGYGGQFYPREGTSSDFTSGACLPYNLNQIRFLNSY